MLFIMVFMCAFVTCTAETVQLDKKFPVKNGAWGYKDVTYSAKGKTYRGIGYPQPPYANGYAEFDITGYSSFQTYASIYEGLGCIATLNIYVDGDDVWSKKMRDGDDDILVNINLKEHNTLKLERIMQGDGANFLDPKLTKMSDENVIIPKVVMCRAVPYISADYFAEIVGWKCIYTHGTLAPISFENNGVKVVINPNPMYPVKNFMLMEVINVGGKPYLPAINLGKTLKLETFWEPDTQILTINNAKSQLVNVFVDRLAADYLVHLYRYKHISDNNLIKYPESNNSGTSQNKFKLKCMNESWVDISQDANPWQGKHIAFLIHGIPLFTEDITRADLLLLASHLLNNIKDEKLNMDVGYDAVYAVEYPLNSPINETGAAVAKFINDHCPPCVKIDVFAHSMGGLVARSAIEGPFPISRKTAESSVAHLITMGTPHQGHPWSGDPKSPWANLSTNIVKFVKPKFNDVEYYDEVLDMEMGKPIDDPTKYSPFLRNLNDGRKTTVNAYSIYGISPLKPYPYTGKKVDAVLSSSLSTVNLSLLNRWNWNDGFMPVASADYNLSHEYKSWKDSFAEVHHDALTFDPSVFHIIDNWIIEDDWFGNKEKTKQLLPITNVALNKPVSVVVTGEQPDAGAGGDPQKITDGRLNYDERNEYKKQNGVIGWVNHLDNTTMTVKVVIDLQGTYNISHIRYNMGNLSRAETWNPDVMITPFGSTSTIHGSEWHGAWTDQFGSATLSKVTITFKKTKTDWDRDWLFIGEIEIYGQ